MSLTQRWTMAAGTNACVGTLTRCQDDLALAANGPGMKSDANAPDGHVVVGRHGFHAWFWVASDWAGP